MKEILDKLPEKHKNMIAFWLEQIQSEANAEFRFHFCTLLRGYLMALQIDGILTEAEVKVLKGVA